MKNLIIIFFLFFILCTAPMQKMQSNVGIDTGTALNQKKADTVVTSSLPKIENNSYLPEVISINQWVGKSFVLLSKQAMFKNFGYELYLTKNFENSKAPLDTAYELKNRHLRCDRFDNHTIAVNSIDSTQSGWIISFLDSINGRTIWAKTYKDAIKEIALKGDLEAARKRWIGKYVFSKRGLISTIDNSGYGSIKVQIQDSLLVDDVVWGVTPLPVKPLWLIVETSQKKKGFIPIRISWTNLMNDLPRKGMPWEEDIFERDPKSLYNWDASIWEVLNNHHITTGMTREQVSLSWGQPNAIFQKQLKGITYECWKFQSQVVYFDSKGITSIENE